jgi:hypothetical protein
MNFLMSDIYDYLMENEFSIGTNFVNEFPETWSDDEEGVIYLAKNSGVALYKITMERV